MFKKTMTFDDLEGEETSQTFYFNYNKKEIAELLEFGYILQYPPAAGETRMPLEKQLKVLSTPVEESGLSELENNKQAYKIFQDLILDAYGKKSDDNLTFEKNAELRNYWASHVAFVDLIFEFLDNPSLAADFIEHCLPKKAVAQAKEEMQKENSGRLTEASLAEMVQEAADRQKDPATRVEPGLAAVAPPVEKSADTVAGIRIEELTATDIRAMSQEDFDALDVGKLNKDQLQVAWARKASS